AAIGSGLPVHDPAGSMIVDVGGGITGVEVISLKDGVFCRSIRVRGDELERDIVSYVKRNYNLLIGVRTAPMIKIQIGTVMQDTPQEAVEVKGRDLMSGVPKTITLTSDEVRESLTETVSLIVQVVREALENTPPELSSDLVDKGIMLAGGGS